MEKILSFKKWYIREIRAIAFTYGELIREAKANFPIEEGKKLYIDYIENETKGYKY